MMAKREAQLITENRARFLNQELQQYFPQRTVEAIKGKRRQQEYKNMVQAFIEHLGNQTQDPEEEEEEEGEDHVGEEFLAFLEALREPRSDDFQGKKLHKIVTQARRIGRNATRHELALYLREIFPPPPQRGGQVRNLKPLAPETKRASRRREYGWTQTMWRKDRRRCISNILENMNNRDQPPREVMEPFWRNIMTADGGRMPGRIEAPTRDGIWVPINEGDIKAAKIPYTTAPGPDRVTARQYRSIPTGVVLRLYNLIMWCEAPPADMLLSRTIFLPKKKEAREPGEFRPITIPPILLRGLHKILARRMEKALDIDLRQRAFRSTDGCADNTLLLDTLLRYHRKKYKSIYMASIDVSKAFDSITHPAIENTLANMGIPRPMLRYLAKTYAESRTQLEGKGWTSKPIHPTRGVRQGDPLSPIIFNAVTHRLLRSLPEEIGSDLGDTSINAAAFADDLLLFASTPAGLQELINVTTKYLEECGMCVNVEKSMTVAIRAAPHLKKTAVEATITFACNEKRLRALTRTHEWRYLGVTFTAEGRAQCHPVRAIKPYLDALTTAPLKPQQRMYALRTVVIPKLYHQLALGAVKLGALNKADKLVRAAVRKWLVLPHDIPTAYFHTTVKEGGLGIPSMRWTAPLSRRGRLLAVLRNTCHEDFRGHIEEELRVCERRLTDHGIMYNTPEMVAERWAKRLYDSVDGAALKESKYTPHQHQWIADGTRLLTGKDYIHCGRIRIGALPTKSRTTRGRYQDRKCRGGCQAQETLNHVLQHCHRTHAARIKRHDAIVKYLARKIPRGGYQVFQEPRYDTEIGLRKPDLVAVLGETAVVVDAQVVSEQTMLTNAHERKKRYYSEPAVVEKIKQTHGVRRVITTSATLSWRGIWSPESARELLDIGYIRKSELKILSTRALIGGLAAFKMFNATTSVEFRRGIG